MLVSLLMFVFVFVYRCWSNCEPSLPINILLVLELECDTCDRYTWSLNLDDSLNLCSGGRFCKLTSLQLSDLTSNTQQLYVTAKGKLTGFFVSCDIFKRMLLQ